MKKYLVLSFFLILLGCQENSGEYGELRTSFNQVISSVEKYTKAFDEADTRGDSKAVAGALEVFAEEFEQLQPKINEIRGKMSEWKNGNSPEELKEVINKFSLSMEEMWNNSTNILKYASDPVVAELADKIFGM